MDKKKKIGRAEYVWLVRDELKKVPARIDTGARTSSIWASYVQETEAGLEYILFGKSSPFYTGRVIVEPTYTEIVVASSNGHVQKRYRVPLTVQIKGVRIKTFCTLADRSTQAYPILVGRNTLRGKFIVDVQNGPRSLNALDETRFNQLQSLLKG